jgi:hypothetical protein
VDRALGRRRRARGVEDQAGVVGRRGLDGRGQVRRGGQVVDRPPAGGCSRHQPGAGPVAQGGQHVVELVGVAPPPVVLRGDHGGGAQLVQHERELVLPVDRHHRVVDRPDPPHGGCDRDGVDPVGQHPGHHVAAAHPAGHQGPAHGVGTCPQVGEGMGRAARHHRTACGPLVGGPVQAPADPLTREPAAVAPGLDQVRRVGRRRGSEPHGATGLSGADLPEVIGTAGGSLRSWVPDPEPVTSESLGRNCLPRTTRSSTTLNL